MTGVNGDLPAEVLQWIEGLSENTKRIYRSAWRKFAEGVANNGEYEKYCANPEALLCSMAKEDPDVFLEDLRASLGWVMATESAATASLFLRAHTGLLLRLSDALGVELSIETPELIEAWKKQEGGRKTDGVPLDASQWSELDPGLRNLVVNTIDTKLMALEMAGTTTEVKEAFLTALGTLRVS